MHLGVIKVNRLRFPFPFLPSFFLLSVVLVLLHRLQWLVAQVHPPVRGHIRAQVRSGLLRGPHDDRHGRGLDDWGHLLHRVLVREVVFAVVFPADLALVDVWLDRVAELLQEGLSLCAEDAHDGVARDADEGNGSDCPAQGVCPVRVLVVAVVVRWLLVVDQTEDPEGLQVEISLLLTGLLGGRSRRSTHKEQEGSSDHPAGTEINRRRLPGHLFHILAESRRAVEPRDGDHLEERQEHDGYGGGIVVNQLEEVDSPLEEKRIHYHWNECRETQIPPE